MIAEQILDIKNVIMIDSWNQKLNYDVQNYDALQNQQSSKLHLVRINHTCNFILIHTTKKLNRPLINKTTICVKLYFSKTLFDH